MARRRVLSWTHSERNADGRFDQTSWSEHMSAFARWRTGVVVQQPANRYASGQSSDERPPAMGGIGPLHRPGCADPPARTTFAMTMSSARRGQPAR
jgi:hypothetical protein